MSLISPVSDINDNASWIREQLEREHKYAKGLLKEAGHVYSECSADGAEGPVVDAAWKAFREAKNLVDVIGTQMGGK